MRRCAPLRPIALGFTRRLTRTLSLIIPLQPWLETALEGIRMCSLEHKNREPTLKGWPSISLISEFLCTVLPSRILGVRRCGWTYVAALHVHLTLRTKRCSESVVASLLHLLLACLPGTLGG